MFLCLYVVEEKQYCMKHIVPSLKHDQMPEIQMLLKEYHATAASVLLSNIYNTAHILCR